MADPATRPTPTPWTRTSVERTLIAAFALVPDHCVYTVRRGFRVSGQTTAADEPLSWGLLHLADDPRGRRLLYAWARCRATNASWSALCREMSWPKTTAEVARIRAAEALAARLNDIVVTAESLSR